ncbi:YIP1 family protein [Myxococcota bacterium]|nr:YIP1 family protein [Myxococcota bacterium]
MRCERCGRDTPTRPGEACLWCGHVAGASPWQTPNVPGGPGVPPSGAYGEGPGIPWENEQNAKNLLETMKLVALSPGATFAGASRAIGMVPSMVFALIVGLAGGVVGLMWQLVLGMNNSEALKNLPPELQGFGEALAQYSQPGVGSIVMLPVGILIGLFIMTVLVHVGLLIFGGANGRFEDSFRAVAFASGATALLQVVPYIGGVIAFFWALVIQVAALRELHGTTTNKALLAVLLPILLAVGCACCGIVAAAGAIGGLVGAGG